MPYHCFFILSPPTGLPPMGSFQIAGSISLPDAGMFIPDGTWLIPLPECAITPELLASSPMSVVRTKCFIPPRADSLSAFTSWVFSQSIMTWFTFHVAELRRACPAEAAPLPSAALEAAARAAAELEAAELEAAPDASAEPAELEAVPDDASAEPAELVAAPPALVAPATSSARPSQPRGPAAASPPQGQVGNLTIPAEIAAQMDLAAAVEGVQPRPTGLQAGRPAAKSPSALVSVAAESAGTSSSSSSASAAERPPAGNSSWAGRLGSTVGSRGGAAKPQIPNAAQFILDTYPSICGPCKRLANVCVDEANAVSGVFCGSCRILIANRPENLCRTATGRGKCGKVKWVGANGELAQTCNECERGPAAADDDDRPDDRSDSQLTRSQLRRRQRQRAEARRVEQERANARGGGGAQRAR